MKYFIFATACLIALYLLYRISEDHLICPSGYTKNVVTEVNVGITDTGTTGTLTRTYETCLKNE